jgi:hypothetical protein
VKETYREQQFSASVLAIIESADGILEEFDRQGFKMTLRGVYYQFIQRDILPESWIDPSYNEQHHLPPDTKNTLKNYKRLGDILANARMAGLIDWDHIEDRGREPIVPLEFEDLEHRVRSALANYRLRRWHDQDCYVELWVEKDAIAAQLEPLASKHHVTLQVNKGYSSVSAMREAAFRFIEASDGGARVTHLFYFGDHDPSGMDMVRDITERLGVFGATEVQVTKLGLTIEQVRRYKLPPNPAKVNDPRAAAYIARYGKESWEVDALTPPQTASLVNAAISAVINTKRLDKVLKQEARDKKDMEQALEKLLKARRKK